MAKEPGSGDERRRLRKRREKSRHTRARGLGLEVKDTVARAIGGSIDLASIGLDESNDEPVQIPKTEGGRLESGDARGWLSRSERESLDGGDTDTEPGERARADGHGESVDLLEPGRKEA